MRDQILRARTFGRRALVTTSAKFVLLSSLAARLYYLQISESDKYKTLSDDNRIRLEPIIPRRGKLFDRYGEIVAENRKHYRVWFNPTLSPKPEETLDKIAAIIGLDEKKYLRLFTLITEKPRENHLIAEHVKWEHVSTIEVNITDLPGIEVSSAQVRYYPLVDSAVHLIGYVAAPDEEEVKKTPLLNHEDFKVGRSGVEYTLENRLRGKAGIRHLEVNAYGLSVRELQVENSAPGEDIKLSIDADLQKFTMQQISDKGGVEQSGGGVVVVDIKTGEVITLASTPGFDPNNFVQGIDHEEWQSLTGNPDKPLLNKVISTQYPPGSTFKLIVALAALEKGVININTKHYCPGFMVFGDRRFHCWNERGHGQVSIRDALAQSCNVFFYKISQDLGVDAIADMSKRFGLGKKTGIELMSEESGLVPSREWKKETLGKDWYNGETINASIGQGYMLVTPIQMAIVAAQIANGGKKVKPTLLKKEDDAAQINLERQGKVEEPSKDEMIKISQNYLSIVREGMEKVVNSPFGTAYQSRIQDKKFAMAGKTGTVQVRHRVEDKKAVIPRKYRNHALFVGYAPIDNPRFAVSVIIEHGGSGSFMAAPIAKEVLAEAQRLHELKSKKKES